MREARARGETLRDIAQSQGVCAATATKYAGLGWLRAENAQLRAENEALRAALEAAGVD